MSLPVEDATGSTRQLKTTESAGLVIPHHIVETLPPLPAGGNVIGKTGYNLKKVITSFVRPANTDVYAVGDAITNSTTVPTVFQLDLASIGAVAGQSLEIRKLVIVSNAKQSLLPFVNAFLNNATFATSNDNAPLDIDDATQEAGGAWLPCDIQNYTVSNSRVAYLGCPMPMILGEADTKLYGTLQAANVYVPVSVEKFTIIAWIALL